MGAILLFGMLAFVNFRIRNNPFLIHVCACMFMAFYLGVGWLAHGLLWVVDAFSRVPGAVFSFRFDFPAMLVAYGMLLSILLYGHTGRSRYLLVILFLLLIILLVRVIEDLKLCGI